MAVELGQAQGSLTLDAAAFFASVQSSIDEIHALHDAAAQAASGVDTLEGSLSGAGGAGAGLSGAMSGMSEAASVATTGVENVGDAATTASTSTGTFRDRLTSAFQTMRDSLPTAEELAAGLENFGNKAVSAGKNMTKYITTPLAGIGVASVKTAADFDASMSRVAAVSGASSEEMEQLTEKAKELGETTKFTASQSADAFNYMAMAGWKTEDMLDGVNGVLDLAAASGADLATTSDIVTDALTAMGKSAGDAGRLADIMAAASSNSNTNVEMMGETFKYAAPLVGAMGYEMEDTAIAIGLMANSGIKASSAGTALRGSLSRLVKPSKEMQATMVQLGLATEETTQAIDSKKLEKAQTKVENKTLDLEKAQLAYDEAVKKYTNTNAPEIQTAMNNVEKAQIKVNDAIAKYGEGSSQAQTAMLNLENAQTKLTKVQQQYSESNPAIEKAAINLQKAQNNLAEAQKELTKEQEGSIINTQLSSKLITDEQGNMRSLYDVMVTLRESFKNLSAEEKAQAASTLFGQHAMSGMLAIINASDEDFEKLTEAVKNSEGAAKNMSEIMQDNLSGQITLLKSKLESVAITIGEIIIPYVTKIVDKISVLLNKFKELDPETQQIIVKLGLIAAAIGPVLTVVGKLAIGLGKIITITKTVGTALSGLFSGLSGIITTGLGTALAGVGAFLAGYGIGTLIYNAIGDEIDEVLHPIFDGVVEAWGVVVEFFTETIPDAFNTCLEFVTGVGSEIADTVSSALSSVAEFFTGIFTSIVETFSGIATWVDENIIQPILSVVVPIVTKIYEINAKIVEIVVTLLGVLATWVYDNVIQPIIGTVTSAVTAIVSKFQDLWNGIVAIWAKIAAWWTEHVSDPISNLMLKASEWISEKFTIAYDKITEVFGVIAEFFSGVWEDIKTVFSVVGTWFGDTFQAAYDKISEIFGGIKDFFSGVWEDIQSVFSTAADYISEAFNSAFAAAFNAAMTGVEDVVNFFVDSLNSVVDVINEIPGVDIGKLDRLSLPKLSVGLDYVPYDNYGAVLHKGERVLTAEENQEYNSGRVGGGDTYIFNSPEPIDERTAAQEMKRVKQELAEGF